MICRTFQYVISCKKKIRRECVGVFRWKKFGFIYTLRKKTVKRE